MTFSCGGLSRDCSICVRPTRHMRQCWVMVVVDSGENTSRAGFPGQE